MSGSGGEKKEKIFFFFFFFTDAEGTFGFRLNSGTNGYRFKYPKTLHHNDLKVLHYIRDTLNIGNVYPSKDKTTASFSVVSQSALKIWIAIFAKYNLNTTKHLDFLAFTSAYELYTQDSSRVARLELKPTLDKILNSMNSKRVYFDLDPSHSLNVSAYWLLGFLLFFIIRITDFVYKIVGEKKKYIFYFFYTVNKKKCEGEGSFYFSGNKLFFSISLRGNRALFDAIQNYLHDLAPEGLKEDVVHVTSMNKCLNQWMLRVSRTDYLEFVLIGSILWYSYFPN